MRWGVAGAPAEGVGGNGVAPRGRPPPLQQGFKIFIYVPRGGKVPSQT